MSETDAPKELGALVYLQQVGARMAATARPVEQARTVDPTARSRRLVEATIPEARRWARFEAEELSARVPSGTAIAATRQAIGRAFVVWTGPSGRGKTSLACAALRSWIEAGHGRRPLFVAAWRLAVARSRHPLGQGEPEIVENALRADLLVLDDFGSEQHSPTSAVPDLIFDREERGSPTWVTTWMDPGQIAKTYGEGIARRVFERALVIPC